MSLRFETPLAGRLLRRYQRFLADVETDAGEKLTVHCPDPGSMHGSLRTGARVRCSTSASPARKLRHTLEMIRVGRSWVGTNPGRANALFARVLARSALAPFDGYASVRAEAAPGPGLRLDFRLEGRADDPRPAWVEVKAVTLGEGSSALFPDSVTLRGRRHLDALRGLRGRGARAALVYVVLRADCAAVLPAEAIDPAYAASLRAAAAGGVELFALGARLSARGIRAERALPVRLS